MDTVLQDCLIAIFIVQADKIPSINELIMKQLFSMFSGPHILSFINKGDYSI